MSGSGLLSSTTAVVGRGVVVHRLGAELDQARIAFLDEKLGGEREAPFPAPDQVRARERQFRPQPRQRCQEVELVPGLEPDEVDIRLGVVGVEAFLGHRNVAAHRCLGEPADGVLVGALERVFDGRAAADDHHHQVVAAVERKLRQLAIDRTVALPELADVGEQGKAARRLAARQVARVLGRAVHQVPLGKGEEGLVRRAPVLGVRSARSERMSGAGAESATRVVPAAMTAAASHRPKSRSRLRLMQTRPGRGSPRC